GGQTLTFDQAGEQTDVLKVTDVCGLCATSSETCLMTDGLGHVHSLSETGLTRLANHNLAFDNHLVGLPS
ncbi:MAG: DUF1513 domain-containing protein, partial [Paracoccaceae bacterium]